MTSSVPAYEAKTGSWEASADVVVVGSGVAGLTAALRAAELGLRTLMVTKGAVDDGNTAWAQGGIAVAAVGHDADADEGHGGLPADSVERHVADTVTAGGDLCDRAVVRSIIAGGPAAVSRLQARGARFDVGSNGVPTRTREGGHSAFRVIHAGGDATGAEVERALVADAFRSCVAVLPRHTTTEVLRTPHGAVCGVGVLDDAGTTGVIGAPAVVLATGGVGQLYAASTNPAVATGDGLALALRAGATVTDMEFVQFHPTALYTVGAGGRLPLVTEAVRGEGAVLVDAAGTPVMTGVHPMADLAPRDVVSAAIARRLAHAPAGVDDHVFLDATALPDFAARFPTVHAACRAADVDPATDPIPVTPAAHFACGGVASTAHGRTGVRGLYAAGEVARTGLHGANRLASNSLLEGLVVGTRAAEAAAEDLARDVLARTRTPGSPTPSSLPVTPRALLQRQMSRYAAIGRTADGLDAAADAIDAAAVPRAPRTVTDVEDAALTLVARAVLTAARHRTETRGCHVRVDHPDSAARWRRSEPLTCDDVGQIRFADAAVCGAA